MAVVANQNLSVISTNASNNTAVVEYKVTAKTSGESWQGYTQEGTFYIDGVKYTSSYTLPENTTTTVVTDKVESNVNKVNYQVRITANGGLNIRSGASVSYSRIGGYAKNSIVTILAESNGFGKTNLGWISLAYTSRYTTVAKSTTVQKYTTGTYKVNCSKLNVRTGPSTKYRIKSLNELTRSARNQGGYVRGVRCTVTKVVGNWGLTPSGYICLDYCTKVR